MSGAGDSLDSQGHVRRVRVGLIGQAIKLTQVIVGDRPDKLAFLHVATGRLRVAGQVVRIGILYSVDDGVRVVDRQIGVAEQGIVLDT